MATSGLIGGSVYSAFADVLGPGLAQYGAQGLQAIDELRSMGAACFVLA
jgi:hypothetical protein